MAFTLKQDDLVKYALGGAATIGILALLIGSAQEDAPAPVRKGPKPYNSSAGAGGFDVSQAYQAEDDEDDYYDSYQADDDDDEDYYSYPADIVVGDHTGHPGPGIPPGPHPGPGPVGGGVGGHPPGPIHPGMDGHPGGPAGFRWGGQRFPLQRYHVTNNMWNWFRGFPHGIFPGTPQLGYPYHQQHYPFFTSPFQCQRFPFSLMPQCRRFRRTPFHFPWQNRRPFQWGGPQHGQFPGRPGLPGHPWMPGPRPGPFPGPGH